MATSKKTPARSKVDDDERLRFGGAEDVRGDRGAEVDPERQEAGLMSDADYENFLENEFEDVALPQPPLLPGWHLCWLSSTSMYDTLQKRARLGYVPVRQSEMPGFDPSNGANIAQDDGFIKCNEMILCKITDRQYQLYMRHFHHKKPLESEEAALAQRPKDGVLASDKEEAGELDMEARIAAAKKTTPTFT